MPLLELHALGHEGQRAESLCGALIPELLEQPTNQGELRFDLGSLVRRNLLLHSVRPLDQGGRPRYQRGVLGCIRRR